MSPPQMGTDDKPKHDFTEFLLGETNEHFGFAYRAQVRGYLWEH